MAFLFHAPGDFAERCYLKLTVGDFLSSLIFVVLIFLQSLGH